MPNDSKRATVPRQRKPSDPLVSGGSDGLGWVTRAIFDNPGVTVTVGDDPSATVRYAVIPRLGNPDAATAFPADFVVDYVKVYQR